MKRLFFVCLCVAAGLGLVLQGGFLAAVAAESAPIPVENIQDSLFHLDDTEARALRVRQSVPIRFGILVGGETPGSVTLDPNGVRQASGGLVEMGRGTYSSAEFEVTGEPGRAFLILLPTEMTLGDRGVRLHSFTSDPSEAGVLGEDGRAVVRVGATLDLPADGAHGQYDESFSIQAEYSY